MITKAGIGLVIMVGLVFTGSFLGTVTIQSGNEVQPTSAPAPTPLARWLDLDAQTTSAVYELDSTFAQDLAGLRGELDEARARLVELLAKDDVSDEELREQIEAVITAHNKVEHRVADYLITVRHHLIPGQRKRLFGLCADEIRQCRKRCGWGNRGQRAGEPCRKEGRPRHGRGGKGGGNRGRNK